MTRQSDQLANLVGPSSRQTVALAAQAACVREVCAPKPGNVNRLHDFADTRFEDFVLSAMAIGPAMLEADRLGVGQIIQQAVRDTRQLVQSNTNLGIVLLLAPLAKACRSSGAVRENVRRILAALTVDDARHTYAAIRMAQPGGMGTDSGSRRGRRTLHHAPPGDGAGAGTRRPGPRVCD